MTNELKKLKDDAEQTYKAIIDTIRTMTSDKPLILFDRELVDEDEELRDKIYELPYGYYVGKYQYYNQGAVEKVHGNNVTLFLTGEEWGEKCECELESLPYWSLVDLLNYLD